MKDTLETAVNYIRVSPILHSATVLTGVAGIGSAYAAIDQFSQGNNELGFLCSGLAFVSSGASVLFQREAVSRFREYHRVKRLFRAYGWDTKIASYMESSACQRRAAEVAAEQVGLSKEIKDYFNARGHRWYHIIPDPVVQDPSLLFKLDFWRQAFRV